jgi:hypothetical protein
MNNKAKLDAPLTTSQTGSESRRIIVRTKFPLFLALIGALLCLASDPHVLSYVGKHTLLGRTWWYWWIVWPNLATFGLTLLMIGVGTSHAANRA